MLLVKTNKGKTVLNFGIVKCTSVKLSVAMLFRKQFSMEMIADLGIGVS